jgi:hypothetical protein
MPTHVLEQYLTPHEGYYKIVLQRNFTNPPEVGPEGENPKDYT